MSELVGVAILSVGALLVLAGSVWLTWLGYRSRWWIGLLLTLTFALGSPLLYGLVRFRDSRRPLLLTLTGLLIGGIPFAWGEAHEWLFGLGERERIINGERHLVLTGWDRPNYDILSTRPDIVVLELGNPDVTDTTLQLLLPGLQLRELTLNDSAVTDAGLATLRQLPQLQSLRLARTKVTKDGIAAFLADPPPQLLQIDVSGNSIPASALRKWRNQDPEQRRYVN